MTTPSKPSYAAAAEADAPASGSLTETPAPTNKIPSGIEPFDAREGGLLPGGSYLIVGPPGPSKMVAALQFLHQGVREGEPCVLVTNADAANILEVARAWGFDMVDAWRDGTLQIVGFRDDFELRAIRSIAPEEVIEELQSLVDPSISRIAVDPGTMFLTGGAKTLLGAAFTRWASNHRGTVLSTFSVDGVAASLPASADWLLHATTARLSLGPASRGLFQLTIARPVPDSSRGDTSVTLELQPGRGLVEPGAMPGRRGADRNALDEGKLLLVSLDGPEAGELGVWAKRTFETDIVSEPFDAVTRLQSGVKYGGVLVHASRKHIRAALQACRALRPLTRAAIVFASDDSLRSTDRVQILEAGADDCLTGGLDFRELGIRMRHSITTGARLVPEGGKKTASSSLPAFATTAETVSKSELGAEVERRAADPEHAFFCVLEISSTVLDPVALEKVLLSHVRHEDGDLVSTGDRGCIVLLQGARVSQLGPFLQRLEARVEEQVGRDGADLEIGVLSHPVDRERIKLLIGSSDAQEN
jgi:CheY-like chemotaxis protein